MLDVKSSCCHYVGKIKSLELWFHSAHHCAKGVSFAGDHELLYNEIYNNANELFDKTVEKMISITDCEDVACPIGIAASSADCLRKYTSPSNANPLNIAVSGCALIKDFIVEIENIHQCLKECNKLTLGTEDLLASTANDYEGYLYKMKQRIKGCIQ